MIGQTYSKNPRTRGKKNKKKTTKYWLRSVISEQPGSEINLSKHIQYSPHTQTTLSSEQASEWARAIEQDSE